MLLNVPARKRSASDLTTNKALPYPCSLDVVSLNTTIPMQEAITNINFSKQDVSDLLQVMLNNMYFSFRDQVFRQREGSPMGSSISGILAILFMDKLETNALSSQLMISPSKRYVDDIYRQTTNEETADLFHHIINNVHPNLKFEIEKPETTPSGLSLLLFDFKVTISKDGNSSFEFYKKPAKNPYSSTINHLFLPNPNSTSFATNENTSRTDAPQIHLQQNTFDDFLCLNGYPENSKEQTKQSKNPNQTLNLPTQSGHTLRSRTFLNNSTTRSLTFSENIPVRIAHKSYMLRQALSYTPKACKCTRDKCLISNTGFCLRWNAVYQLTCNSCDQQCIGSTTRFIHDRVKEHLDDENSSMKIHIYSCQNKDYKGIDVKIIMSENDTANLCLYEAFYIRKCKPTLNSREECSEFADLVF